MGREDLQKIKLRVGSIVKNQWQIFRKIGEGGCGIVYQVVNIRNPLQQAAMKVEPFGMLQEDEILKMEVLVLKKLANSKHACKIFASGKAENYFFLIMTLLSKSLSELRKISPNQSFTLSTSIRLGMQCLESIKELHDVGFIHRDVKPSNFAIGRLRNSRTIFMLDFGLARQYATFKPDGTMVLREPRRTVPFRGTVRYCSVNAHRREEQGRHDDIWSLFYMTSEMILGVLPWRNMDRPQAEKCKRDSEKQLLAMLPKELRLFARHLKKLNYNRQPDYDLLKSVLEQVLTRNKIKLTDQFDWEPYGLSGIFSNDWKNPKPKQSDEKREFDKGGDINTRMDVRGIEDEENIVQIDESEDEGASHVSGVSATDDTIQKIDDL